MRKRSIGALALLTGLVGGAVGTISYAGGKLNESKQLSEKHLELFLMMNQWVKVKQEGKSLASYLNAKGYRKVAIYGMSYAGETLVNELQGSDIEIAYGIDKNADKIYSDINIVSMEGDLESVDAIVVTAITYFDEIAKKLEEKIDCPIVSLEDILYEV